MEIEQTPAELMAAIEAGWARLREIVGGVDAALLDSHPKPKSRSVIEVLRHLLFAEQAHVAQMLKGGQRWHRLGVPPPGLMKRKDFVEAGMGEIEGVTAEEVFAAWEPIHAEVRALVEKDTPAVRLRMWKNLRHLQAHIKEVESLLRAAAKQRTGAVAP